MLVRNGGDGDAVAAAVASASIHKRNELDSHRFGFAAVLLLLVFPFDKSTLLEPTNERTE